MFKQNKNVVVDRSKNISQYVRRIATQGQLPKGENVKMKFRNFDGNDLLVKAEVDLYIDELAVDYAGDPRDYALNLVDTGTVTAENLLACALKYMSHDDVRDMLDANELSPRFADCDEGADHG